MNSIYVFRYAPSSIKRLISLYLIGLGTPTSTLIKEEYDKLYNANRNNIIVTEHMCYYIDKDIGFMGCRNSSNSEYPNPRDTRIYDLLLPPQMYEINSAKLFYLYNYSNNHKFKIILSIREDNICLEKIFKYKYFQLINEE
jgi:hypothetical protein